MFLITMIDTSGMNKTIVVFLVLVSCVMLGIGGYYFVKKPPLLNSVIQYADRHTPQGNNANTQNLPPPQPLSDKDSIRQVISQKTGKPISQLRITFTQDPAAFNNLYASGILESTTGTGGGAIWYAAKAQGEWALVAVTKGPVSCTLANHYQLPPNMLHSCIDVSGKIVTR